MLEGILIGSFVTMATGAAVSLLWMKKQGYERIIEDMGKKHEVEKIILQDKISELMKEKDIESKYRNSNGLLTHKRLKATEEQEERM